MKINILAIIIIFCHFFQNIECIRKIGKQDKNENDKGASSAPELQNNNTILSNNTIISSNAEPYDKKLELIWANMFTNYDTRKCVKNDNRLGKYDKDGKKITVLPKPNTKQKLKFENKRGEGEVGFFFDYIDELLQADITNEFTKILGLAVEENKKKKNDPSDPYDMEAVITEANRLFLIPNSPGLKYKLDTTKMSDSELTERIKNFSPDFDLASYREAITIPTLNKIMVDWSYDKKYRVSDLGKYVMDHYDLDGDGRLNAREFILFTVNINNRILGQNMCKNCYTHIVVNKINPLFDFMDCDGDGMLTTEEICEGVSHLKRTDNTKLNMFNCKVQDILYRTTSCNDLILKNQKTIQGHLSQKEFRQAILLGYWDRQVDKSKIYLNDEINRKYNRWSRDGRDDLFCSKLNEYSG